LRVGQKITLISAGLKNEQSGYFSVLVNHNSQEHYFITKAAQLNQYLSVEKASGKSILFAILLGLIGFTILPFVIAAFLVMSFCVYRAYTKITSIKQMYKSLDNHLERLAQDTYGRKTETIAPLNDEKANNGRYAIYMKNDHYCAVDTEDFFSFDELNDLLWNGYQYITNVDADSKEQALDIVSKEQK
jgi:hypothetical protein